MLAELGASKEEDLLYGHLVTVVSADVAELVAATGLAEADVRTGLAGLVERRLAHRMTEEPTRYAAASPSVVESMIAGRIAELRVAQSTLDQVAARYRANSLAAAGAGVFEIVRGADALRECVVGMISSARAELLNMIKPPVISVRPAEHLRPGDSVRGRVVFETEAMDVPGDLPLIHELAGPNAEARLHAELPIKLMAVDRSMALIPLAQRDTTPVGVLVREGALLDALLSLFDHVWATAVPVHFDEETGSHRPTVLDAEDRRLLSMLLAGLTDEAIAARRGISVRTVQRRVRTLMAAAHVRTRMQLAWTAAKQNWM